ncbi:uncharacterized protein LOC118768477 [Octopus sinensis]|uniref:Uncharacterized protein LOC118768477 n=1 Tax=Octopus sinensis TaxID=2607531 RepID=A0A7E6FTS7_9MOLL|nr:uncharacterized protein LOC118768477 [Octopus sinensis]
MKIIILLSILLILLQAYTGTSRRYYARHKLEALARYQSHRRRKQTERTCSKWRETCQPWSNSKSKCCDPSSLVCKCNLWMQNCRCVNKLWGG